jgi:hypothetical protein
MSTIKNTLKATIIKLFKRVIMFLFPMTLKTRKSSRMIVELISRETSRQQIKLPLAREGLSPGIQLCPGI